MDVLVRYSHFLFIILFCGILLLENALIRKEMRRSEIGRLARVDRLFGLCAMAVIAAGMLLWFRYGKGSGFYTHNPVFHAKLALFATGALLSIYPTVFFIRQSKGDSGETVRLPSKVIAMVRLQLAIVLLIPLPAVLMAKGIGFR